MKLEEWKRFLDSIPDNEYTRTLDYTEFGECETMKVGDNGYIDCFVLLDEELTSCRWADAKKGIIEILKSDEKNICMLDKDGNVIREKKYGDVKIVKYKYNP